MRTWDIYGASKAAAVSSSWSCWPGTVLIPLGPWLEETYRSAADQLIVQLKTSCHSFPEKARQKHQNPTCNAKAKDLALAIVAEPKDIYLRISQFSTKFYLGWIHGALMTTQVSSIGASLQDLGDGNSSPQNQDLPVAAGLAISPGARQWQRSIIIIISICSFNFLYRF